MHPPVIGIDRLPSLSSLIEKKNEKKKKKKEKKNLLQTQLPESLHLEFEEGY
jgi:hypothetical protein